MEFGEIADLVIREMTRIVAAGDDEEYVVPADRINAAQVLLNAAQSLDMQRQQDEQTALQRMMYEHRRAMETALADAQRGRGPELVVPMPVIGKIGN